MEIISLHFAVLGILSVLIYYLLSHKYRKGYLTLLSLAFIFGLNYYLPIYILIYSFINYYIGIKIPVVRSKKALFRLGLIINLSQLIVLKYASFAIDPIFQIFNLDLNISGFSEFIVPLGISYVTLQAIGYLVNVKMGWEKPEKNFPDYLLYIIFYPKFLSGPIERSNHFLPQIKAAVSFDSHQVSEGLRIALLGFFKKVVIANQLGIVVNNVYSDIDAFGGLNLWIIILIQPLYLYFDFSGYTYIALGFAKMYGINLLPNFDRPFLSQNMTIFWRRFHMSLSLWFNDYVFKQISFRYRRWGKYASVFAVFVTWTLFGIWHGAGWNFMILGFVQALAINWEYFMKNRRMAIFSKMPHFIRVWSGRIITFIFFGSALVFFFSPSIGTTMTYFEKLGDLNIRFYLGTSSKVDFFLGLTFLLLFMIVEIMQTDYINKYKKFENFWASRKYLRVGIYYVMVFLILFQLSGDVSFIYQMF